MEWTVTIEGPDEFGEIQRAQVQIEKGFERLASGEIGLSIDNGKRIMSALQEFVVKEELTWVIWVLSIFNGDLCSGAASLRIMRKAAASQGLHEPDNSHCVWNPRSEKPALDGLPALLSPLFHGLHGSRRNLPRPGYARTHGVNGALGQHVAVPQGRGALGRVPAH